MIKYNNSNINDWYFDASDIIKVYRNNAVCYYKITTSGGTSGQTPCYAVVEDISQYQDTEFEDVFNKADGKWYKLNNLNNYEEYGIYGSGRTITYYDGKLTVDDGYEYQYSGNSRVNVGEVSGSTASLPNVPFTINYNAKQYNSSTKTLPKTSGQLADIDAVVTEGTPTVGDGYLTIASGTRATLSGYQTYFNRDSNNPNITIVSKQTTSGSNPHLLANRDSNYNWMYRCYSNKLTLHGSGEQGSVAVTTQPVIESVRIDSRGDATYNNYTDNTSSTKSGFSYGGANTGGTALFAGYASGGSEWFEGNFYWIYMSQSTLTDEQIQQVIDYNEGGGGTTEYPVYYDELQDPPNYISFSSMTEAESYECPWWGMNADIDNVAYMFCDNNEWLTKYSYQEVQGEYLCDSGNKYKKMQEYDRNVDGTMSATTNYVIGDLIESASTDCQYKEYEYIQNQTGNYRYKFNTNFYPTTANTIEIKFTLTGNSIDWGCIICWSNCQGDNCDSTQFRFTTVTDAYQIIGRKGKTNGINRYTIGTGKTITVTLPLSSNTYTYNSGTSSTYNCNFNAGEFSLPSSTPMHIWSIGPEEYRYAANLKIYYVKVYDANGNVVKHYVPSDSNGAPCFFEKIDNDYILDTYSGSEGGTLTLGPQV